MDGETGFYPMNLGIPMGKHKRKGLERLIYKEKRRFVQQVLVGDRYSRRALVSPWNFLTDEDDLR